MAADFWNIQQQITANLSEHRSTSAIHTRLYFPLRGPCCLDREEVGNPPAASENARAFADDQIRLLCVRNRATGRNAGGVTTGRGDIFADFDVSDLAAKRRPPRAAG